MYFNKLFFYSILLCWTSNATAQVWQSTLHPSSSLEFERRAADSGQALFTSIHPIQYQWLQTPPVFSLADTGKSKWHQRIWDGHLLRYQDANINLYADPILNIEAGASQSPWKRTALFSRGINAEGMIGKKITFGWAVTENQGGYPLFVMSFVNNNRQVLPGQGMVRKFRSGGYDFAWSDAWLRWTSSGIFSATLGYGKHFIGEGYRSLFLSDNAFNYPYLQLNLQLKRFHYMVLYNQYQNLVPLINNHYQKKWSTIHYLTVAVSKRLQLGLFEGVIWQAEDSLHYRGFDFAYLNPVPFLRPVEFSLGSADNAFIGLHAKYHTGGKNWLYSQLFIDDLNIGKTLDSGKQHLNNKYAIQLGFKTFRQLGPIQTFLRIEYNYARPYTYGHRQPAQNYTHYNQPLAHPLGANFHEAISQFVFNYQRLYLQYLQQFAWIGKEDFKGYPKGNNLFAGETGVPLFGSTTLQGIKTRQICLQAQMGYIINPSWNMALQGSILYKKIAAAGTHTNNWWIQAGIVTRLRNVYWDF